MNFKKILPVLTLLFALVVAFAFKPVHKANVKTPTGNIFQFNGTPGNDELDPLWYTDVTGIFDPGDGEGADCPGSDVLCAIITTEIYTALDAPSSPFVGQPKVDLSTTAIRPALITALQSPADDDVVGVYFKNEQP